MTISTDNLLQVTDLHVYFHTDEGIVKAVDGATFTIPRGKTVCVVGESGCGKSVTARAILQVVNQPGQIVDGTVNFDQADGNVVDLATLPPRGKEIHAIRGQDITMIYQEPYASLNLRLPVLEISGEVLKVNGLAKGKDLEARVSDIMNKVGLSSHYLHRYPHAFSGGQRQRIGSARALAPNPRLVIADELVSALDVSVQAQILNLMKDLQAEFNLTYLFISHDLSVVAHISDRVAVMYVGKIVELAPTATLFQRPQHPYTEALLSAVLHPDPTQRNITRIHLEGSVADPSNPPSGCAFHPRCRYAQERCQQELPPLRENQAGHLVACHFAETLDLVGVG